MDRYPAPHRRTQTYAANVPEERSSDCWMAKPERSRIWVYVLCSARVRRQAGSGYSSPARAHSAGVGRWRSLQVRRPRLPQGGGQGRAGPRADPRRGLTAAERRRSFAAARNDKGRGRLSPGWLVILSAHAKDLSCVRLAPAWERFLAEARNDKYQGWAPRLTESLRSTTQCSDQRDVSCNVVRQPPRPFVMLSLSEASPHAGHSRTQERSFA